MEQTFSNNNQYKRWIVELKGRIKSAQIKAAVTVNRQLLELYWELGKEICEKQKTAAWGDGLIEQLVKDLSGEFPGMKGFSRRNLMYIRQWYLFYEDNEIVQQAAALIGNVQQFVAKIPWWHNVVRS